MVSQRYLAFKHILYTFWKRLGKYWLLIYGFGLLIGFAVDYTRHRFGTYGFIWLFGSLAVTYILFFLLYKPTRDMDGDI